MQSLLERPYEDTELAELSVLNNPNFMPNAYDLATFGWLALEGTAIIDVPHDIPSTHIATNPSAIMTVYDSRSERAHDVLYERVEPNLAGKDSSHLGKTVSRPYRLVASSDGFKAFPFNDAMEIPGEDPRLTRINVPLRSGIRPFWLVSSVLAIPKADQPNVVESFHEVFYMGETLKQLEQVGRGPDGMKDANLAQRDRDPETTALGAYGRPQEKDFTGNITYAELPKMKDPYDALNNADYIDEDLLPDDSGIWGGVNDVVPISPGKNILIAHFGWRVGENGRHYEKRFLGHHTDIRCGHKKERRIVNLSRPVTSQSFAKTTAKEYEGIDLNDVIFSGGAFNGSLTYTTAGLRDSGATVSRMVRFCRN